MRHIVRPLQGTDSYSHLVQLANNWLLLTGSGAEHMGCKNHTTLIALTKNPHAYAGLIICHLCAGALLIDHFSVMPKENWPVLATDLLSELTHCLGIWQADHIQANINITDKCTREVFTHCNFYQAGYSYNLDAQSTVTYLFPTPAGMFTLQTTQAKHRLGLDTHADATQRSLYRKMLHEDWG